MNYTSIRDGSDMLIVFLDVTKPFDHIYHDGLLYKLYKQLVLGIGY